MAKLLVTAKSDLVAVRDKREKLALDLVKYLESKWTALLLNQ